MKALSSPGAVAILALCSGSVSGDARRKYLEESLAGLKRLVDELGYKNVARLKTDGSLDASFGSSGTQLIDFDFGDRTVRYPYAIADGIVFACFVVAKARM